VTSTAAKSALGAEVPLRNHIAVAVNASPASVAGRERINRAQLNSLSTETAISVARILAILVIAPLNLGTRRTFRRKNFLHGERRGMERVFDCATKRLHT
jgi:hypothetical protein